MVGAVYVVGILPLMESLNLLCVDMNALELADELENTYPFVGVMEVAAIMLRKQQADLKDADKYALELERLYEDAKAEIEALKDKLMLAKQSLEIVEGWIKK